MAQGFMAGCTSYDDQSLSDIKKDIEVWIEYSQQVIEKFENTLNEIKASAFYKTVPYEYKSLMSNVPMICKTNIEDFSRTLKAIENQKLTKEIVQLFRKIGVRAITNNDENQKCYKSNGDEYWHDYDDPTFKKIENLYATFGDYTATLWDVTNAASRLMDYIDIPKEVTTMKYEDNSINIGDNNTLVQSPVGSENKVEAPAAPTPTKESWYSKLFWQIAIPVLVGVIVAIICVALGIGE